MKHIIISPYSRKSRNGLQNPKNYPYWVELIDKIHELKLQVFQVGIDGEDGFINSDFFFINKSFDELEELVKDPDCLTWISVDNFFQHFCDYIKVPGIVLWSVTDPAIFGHDTNINLIKGSQYLRQNQFEFIENTSFNPDAFVKPTEVVKTLIDICILPTS